MKTEESEVEEEDVKTEEVLPRKAKQFRLTGMSILITFSLAVAMGIFVGSILQEECSTELSTMASWENKPFETPQITSDEETSSGKNHLNELMLAALSCGKNVTRPASLLKHARRLVEALQAIFDGIRPFLVLVWDVTCHALSIMSTAVAKGAEFVAGVDWMQLAKQVVNHPLTQAATSIPVPYTMAAIGFLFAWIILWRSLGFRRSIPWMTALAALSLFGATPQLQQLAAEAFLILWHLVIELLSCVTSGGKRCAFTSTGFDEGNPPQVVLWVKIVRSWVDSARTYSFDLQDPHVASQALVLVLLVAFIRSIAQGIWRLVYGKAMADARLAEEACSRRNKVKMALPPEDERVSVPEMQAASTTSPDSEPESSKGVVLMPLQPRSEACPTPRTPPLTNSTPAEKSPVRNEKKSSSDSMTPITISCTPPIPDMVPIERARIEEIGETAIVDMDSQQAADTARSLPEDVQAASDKNTSDRRGGKDADEERESEDGEVDVSLYEARRSFPLINRSPLLPSPSPDITSGHVAFASPSMEMTKQVSVAHFRSISSSTSAGDVLHTTTSASFTSVGYSVNPETTPSPSPFNSNGNNKFPTIEFLSRTPPGSFAGPSVSPCAELASKVRRIEPAPVGDEQSRGEQESSSDGLDKSSNGVVKVEEVALVRGTPGRESMGGEKVEVGREELQAIMATLVASQQKHSPPSSILLVGVFTIASALLFILGGAVMLILLLSITSPTRHVGIM